MNVEYFIIPEGDSRRLMWSCKKCQLKSAFHWHQMVQFKHHKENTHKGLKNIKYVKV